jgi:hypothetical protein
MGPRVGQKKIRISADLDPATCTADQLIEWLHAQASAAVSEMSPELRFAGERIMHRSEEWFAIAITGGQHVASAAYLLLVQNVLGGTSPPRCSLGHVLCELQRGSLKIRKKAGVRTVSLTEFEVYDLRSLVDGMRASRKVIQSERGTRPRINCGEFSPDMDDVQLTRLAQSHLDWIAQILTPYSAARKDRWTHQPPESLQSMSDWYELVGVIKGAMRGLKELEQRAKSRECLPGEELIPLDKRWGSQMALLTGRVIRDLITVTGVERPTTLPNIKWTFGDYLTTLNAPDLIERISGYRSRIAELQQMRINLAESPRDTDYWLTTAQIKLAVGATPAQIQTLIRNNKTKIRTRKDERTRRIEVSYTDLCELRPLWRPRLAKHLKLV